MLFCALWNGNLQKKEENTVFCKEDWKWCFSFLPYTHWFTQVTGGELIVMWFIVRSCWLAVFVFICIKNFLFSFTSQASHAAYFKSENVDVLFSSFFKWFFCYYQGAKNCVGSHNFSSLVLDIGMLQFMLLDYKPSFLETSLFKCSSPTQIT